MESKKKDGPESQNIGRAEMNLVEFPVTTIHQADKRDILEYEGWITDKNGNRFLQKWTVRASAGIGLPNEKGDEILTVLVTQTMRQAVPRKLGFSIYRLLKTMRLPMNQKHYQRIEQLLKQLAGETIYAERAFWDNDAKEWVTIEEAFHVFDKLWIRKRSREGKLPKDTSYIIWGEPFWKSMKQGYVKPIDLDFYFGVLKRPISKKLYSFLDKQLWYRNEFEIDIFTLSTKLGMAPYSYPSKIKEKLQPALNELITHGFLATAEVVKRGAFTRLRFIKAGTPQITGEVDDAEALPEPMLVMEQEDSHEEPQERYGITDEHHVLWEKIVTELKPHLSPATFRSFVAPTILLTITDGVATIGARNPMAQSWLQSRMVKRFKEELNYHLRAAHQPQVSSVTIVALAEELVSS